MKKYFYIVCFLFVLLLSDDIFAQCSGGTLKAAITPTTSWQTYVNIYGGYYLTFNATSGNTYIFSFCQGGGSASFDTQLTILNNSGTYANGFNDDNCGLQSEVTWVAPSTATYRVLISQYNCTSNSTNCTLAYEMIVPEMRVPASGSNSYTACSGHIYDEGGSGGNYNINDEGYSIIYPTSASMAVQLTGTYTCETGFDYVYIYDGAGTGGTLLGTFNNTSGGNIGTITSSGANVPLTVRFHSDGSIVYSGFDFTIACVSTCTTPTAGSISPSSTNPCVAAVTINSTVNATSSGTLYIEWYRWSYATSSWTYLGQNNSQTITDHPADGTYWYLRRTWSSCYANCNGCIDAYSTDVTFDATGPTQDALTVSSNCWICDNAHNYTITEQATDVGGIGGGSYGMLAIINYGGENASANGPTNGGYFAWNTTLANLNAYGFTADQSACAGGGFVGKAAGSFGDTKITLVSGSTSVAGNQRTVVFTVRPNSTFPILADNDVSFYTTDACSNPTGWTNWQTDFSSGTSVLGTVNNAGPIDFCSATCDWSAIPISVSGNTGTVMWDYGWSSGGWSATGTWVNAASPGYSCFPKKVAASDGNADRVRWSVQNGACPATGYSAAILIRNHYNEVPGSLASSINNICAGTAGVLTATFPTATDILGTVEFATSCGGAPFASIAGNGTTSVATAFTAPASTTTYYVRYNPGTGAGCSATACVNTTVTITGAATPYAGPDQYLCAVASTSMAATAVAGGTWSFISGPAGYTITTPGSATSTITGLVSGTYVFRWNGGGGCGAAYDDVVIVRQ